MYAGQAVHPPWVAKPEHVYCLLFALNMHSVALHQLPPRSIEAHAYGRGSAKRFAPTAKVQAQPATQPGTSP